MDCEAVTASSVAASQAFAGIAVCVKSVSVEERTAVPAERETPDVLIVFETVGIAVPPLNTQRLTVTVSAVVLIIDQFTMVQAKGTRK